MLVSLLAVLGAALVSPTRAVLPRHAFPAAASINDAQILGALSILNAAMIEAAELGSSKASSQAVRDYANMLLSDHRASQQEGDTLAMRLGITPALPPDKSMASEHIETMARLNQRSGAAFDRAFMEAMVEDHERVISTVNADLLPKASNAELKAFILKLQPTLNKHEQVGREWLDSHKS